MVAAIDSFTLQLKAVNDDKIEDLGSFEITNQEQAKAFKEAIFAHPDTLLLTFQYVESRGKHPIVDAFYTDGEGGMIPLTHQQFPSR